VANAQWTLDVSGSVKKKETKKRFEGVTITIKKNGSVWKTITSPSNGKFDVSLEPNGVYLIEFSKPGHVTKKIEFSTKNVPPEDAKYGFEFPMEMTLFEKREGLDVSILNQPIAKVAFDPTTGYMDYDPAYTKSIKKELDRLNKELDELLKQQAANKKANQAKYDKLIASADKLYNDEKWKEAKPLYEQAEAIFPDESYPMFQLAEIEDKLAKEAEANKRYNAAITMGDEAFKNKEWDKATLQYQKAAGYNPEKQYPKDKIKEIKNIIANEKKVSADYNAAIADADKAFGVKDYETAKENYQKASALKSYEEYPKTKLAEIDKLLGEQQKLEADYKAAITEADGYFNTKDYENAITAYNKATKIKPNEQYPKDKISEANKILADQEKLDADYKSFIAQADKSFGEKDYSAAKMSYQQAASVKKEEQYPKDKLKEIEDILADMAKKEAEEKQKEADYIAAITNGDKAFAVKNYELAKQSFQLATEIKTEEKYPKDKLKEIDDLLADLAKSEAEQKAKDEKYQQLITEADNLLGSKDYENAKGKYNEALIVKSEEQYPKDKIIEIDGLLADLAKSEAEQKAKDEKYQQLITEADNLLGSKDYENAKGKYNEALAVKSEEQYPKDKLKEIEDILANLAKIDAEQKAKDEKYQQLITEADNLLGSKDYENAKGKYNEALTVKTEEKYPKEKIAEIDGILADLAKLQAEKDAKEKAAAELQAKYDALISSADQSFNGKEYEKSKEKYNEALAVKQDEQYPKDRIKEIENILAELAKKKAEEEAAKMAEADKDAKYQEVITLADNAFKFENYQQSKIKYNEALTIKPNEQYPKDKLKEIDDLLAAIEKKKQEEANAALAQKELNEKYQGLISSADGSFAMKEYEKAKSDYSLASNLKPTEQYPINKIKEIEGILAEIAKQQEEEGLAAEAERKKREYFDALIAQADDAFNTKNYEDAKAKYQQALGLIPQAEYPTNRLKEIEKLLKNLEAENSAAAAEKALNDKYDGLISVADKAFLDKDYSTAKVKYNAALAVKPNETYPPVKLAEIENILANLSEQQEEIKVTNNALKQKKIQYDAFVQKGDLAFTGKQYKNAINNYEKALSLMPNEIYPKDKIAQIEQLLNDLAAKEKDAENEKLAEKEKRDKYNKLVYDGDRAFKFQKYEEAKLKFTEAWSLYPNEKYPPAKLAEIEEMIKKQKEENEVVTVTNTNAGNRAKINDDNEKAIEKKMAEMLLNKNKDREKAFNDVKKGYEGQEEIRISKAKERTDYAAQVLDEIEQELAKQREKGDQYHLKYFEELKKAKKEIEAAEKERIANAEKNRALTKSELVAIQTLIVKFKHEQEKRSKEKDTDHNVFVDNVNEAKVIMVERGDEMREANRKVVEKLTEETQKNNAKAKKRAEELTMDVHEYREELNDQEEIRITAATKRTKQNKRDIDRVAIRMEKERQKKSQYYKLNVEDLITFKENINKIESQRIKAADKKRMENDKIKEQYQKEFIEKTKAAQKKYYEDIAYLDDYKSDIQEQERENQKAAKEKQIKEAKILEEYKKILNKPPPNQEKRNKEFKAKLDEERRMNEEFLSDMVALSKTKQIKANEGLKDFYKGEKQLSENKELASKYPEGITEETIESGNSITIKRIKVTGTHVDVYERVFYSWGGNYFYKNGVNITKSLWDKESIE
jgi:tetratricopeptide (TPR) repeat protein